MLTRHGPTNLMVIMGIASVRIYQDQISMLSFSKQALMEGHHLLFDAVTILVGMASPKSNNFLIA